MVSKEGVQSMNHNYPFGLEYQWPIIDGPRKGYHMSSLAPRLVLTILPETPPFSAEMAQSPCNIEALHVEHRLFRIADGIFVWSTKSELVFTPVA